MQQALREELQSHLQKMALTPTHHILGLYHQIWEPTTGKAVVPRGPSLGRMDGNGALDLSWPTDSSIPTSELEKPFRLSLPSLELMDH